MDLLGVKLRAGIPRGAAGGLPSGGHASSPPFREKEQQVGDSTLLQDARLVAVPEKIN